MLADKSADDEKAMMPHMAFIGESYIAAKGAGAAIHWLQPIMVD